MKSIAALIVLLPTLSFAVTLDPYRVPESVDLAARGRVLASALNDPGSEASVYLLADKTERLDKSLAETTMGIENVGLLIPYLATTDDGPKQVTEHLISFMDELKTLDEQLSDLKKSADASLAAAQPGTKVIFAAQSLKQRALNLRTHLEGLREKAQVLATNVTADQAKLGAAAAAAAKELSDRQVLGLRATGDGLLLTADQLVRKVQ